jgi:hypothetical protein
MVTVIDEFVDNSALIFFFLYSFILLISCCFICNCWNEDFLDIGTCNSRDYLLNICVGICLFHLSKLIGVKWNSLAGVGTNDFEIGHWCLNENVGDLNG